MLSGSPDNVLAIIPVVRISSRVHECTDVHICTMIHLATLYELI